MRDGGGYIQLWRRCLDSEAFEDATLWRVFCWALLSAEWRDGEQLPPGAFRVKIRDAAEDLKMPTTTLYRSLRRLVDLGCLSLSSGAGRGGKTVVSVCNWGTYQPSAKSEKARNIFGTKAEHCWNKSGTKKRDEAEQKQAPLKQGEEATCDIDRGHDGTLLEQKRNIVSESAEHSFRGGGTRSNKDEEYKEEEEVRRRSKKNSGDAPTLIRVPWVDHLPEGELSFASARQCDGQPECFKVADSKIKEWQATWPSLNVRVELRKASQWLRDNPTRRKTPAGLLRFLSAWLERAVDRGARGSAVQGAGESRSQRTVEAAQRYMATMGGSDS